MGILSRRPTALASYCVLLVWAGSAAGQNTSADPMPGRGELRVSGQIAALDPRLPFIKVKVTSGSQGVGSKSDGDLRGTRMVMINDLTTIVDSTGAPAEYRPSSWRPGDRVDVVGMDLEDGGHTLLARRLALGSDPAAAPSARAGVLLQINESHEALFEFDEIAAIASRQGIDSLVTDMSLSARVNNLAETDILFVRQTLPTTLDFAGRDAEATRQFVAEGGGLLLYGFADLGIGKLGNVLGLSLQGGAVRGPLRVGGILRDLGATPQIPLPFPASRGCLRAPGGAQTVISGVDGQPVAVAFTYGRGRVVAVCDNGWALTVRTEDQPQKLAVSAFYGAALRWLTPQGRTPRDGGGDRLHAFGELARVIDDYLYVQYPRTLEREVNQLASDLPGVVAAVAKVCGTRPPAGRLAIYANPTAFYSGGGFIGIGCAGDEVATLGVMTHEIGHSYVGPLPSIFGEGLATLTGNMGFATLTDPRFKERQEAVRKDRSYADLYAREDPTGTKLDIAKAETEEDHSKLIAYQAKAMCMLEELESTYPGAIGRAVRVIRALKGRACPTVQEVLHCMELAAGTDADLADWYKRHGVSYQRPARISAAELQRALDAYMHPAGSPAP